PKARAVVDKLVSSPVVAQWPKTFAPSFLIPRRLNEPAHAQIIAPAQIHGIRRKYPFRFRSKGPYPSWPEDTAGEAFHMPRRDIYHETIKLSAGNGLEVFSNSINVPTINECLTRLDLMPRKFDE